MPPCPELLSPEQPLGSITRPLILSGSLRFTPEPFSGLWEANPDAVRARAADGSLICLAPTGSDTDSLNGELFFPIKAWARATGGWKAFDSSTGFRLPDDPFFSPDLVVELASARDEGSRGLMARRRKMAAYLRNGVPEEI